MIGAVQGWSDTVPLKALKLFEMARFLERIDYHWTVTEYLNTPAGAIAWLREYWAMTAKPVVETADTVEATADG